MTSVRSVSGQRHCFIYIFLAYQRRFPKSELCDYISSST